LSQYAFARHFALTLGTVAGQLTLSLGTLAIHRAALGRSFGGQPHRVCPLLDANPRLFGGPLGSNSRLVPMALCVE
jgi:hypothetical protein